MISLSNVLKLPEGSRAGLRIADGGVGKGTHPRVGRCRTRCARGHREVLGGKVSAVARHGDGMAIVGQRSRKIMDELKNYGNKTVVMCFLNQF